MMTSGYDVVVELDEKLISSFLKLEHCMGKLDEIKQLSGTYTLDIPEDKVPSGLKDFLKIGYKISLDKAPEFRIRDDLTLEMILRGQCKFVVLGGIEFEIEAEFTVGFVPSFDQSTRRFKIDSIKASLNDLELNDNHHLPNDVINLLNEIISTSMGKYLGVCPISVQLSPVIFSTELPYMPPGDENKLKIGSCNIKVLNPRVIAGAINLLDYNGGDINAVTDFTDGNDVAIGIREAVMHRVFDFWWNRTSHPKSVNVKGTKEFDIRGISGFTDNFVDWLTTIASCGFMKVDVDLKKVWADYNATIQFSELGYDLKPNNNVEISCSVTLDLDCKIYATITSKTTAFWGSVTIDEKETTIKPFDSRMRVKTNLKDARGQIAFNSNRQLIVNLKNVDVDIPLPPQWNMPEKILDDILDWTVKQVMKNLPPIILYPAVITSNIPDSTATVKVNINKFVTDEPEVIVGCTTELSSIGTYARYVGNKDPQSMELHFRGCGQVAKIDEKNKAYFCEIETAKAVGFKDCANGCLSKVSLLAESPISISKVNLGKLSGASNREIPHDFSPVLPSSPIVIPGLNLLDADCRFNTRLVVSTDKVTKDRFSLKYGTWGDSVIYGCAATSVVIHPSSKIQAGMDTTPSRFGATVKVLQVDKPIKFATPFVKPPKVTVNLYLLDIDKMTPMRIFVEARNVTSEGFNLHYETWADSLVWNASASWIAVPQDESRIQIGTDRHEAYSGDPKLGNPEFWYLKGSGERIYNKRINFERPFRNIPEVITNLSGLGLSNKANTRVSIRATNITNNGFNLEYKTWVDSITDQIRVNWMAIDKA